MLKAYQIKRMQQLAREREEVEEKSRQLMEAYPESDYEYTERKLKEFERKMKPLVEFQFI